MAAMTNAQRQARWRERHHTGDLFPPLNDGAHAKKLQRYVTVSVVGYPQSLSVQLLPCQFCGGVPACMYYPFVGSTRVFCKRCECSFNSFEPFQSLVDLWNRRV